MLEGTPPPNVCTHHLLLNCRIMHSSLVLLGIGKDSQCPTPFWHVHHIRNLMTQSSTSMQHFQAPLNINQVRMTVKLIDKIKDYNESNICIIWAAIQTIELQCLCLWIQTGSCLKWDEMVCLSKVETLSQGFVCSKSLGLVLQNVEHLFQLT